MSGWDPEVLYDLADDTTVVIDVKAPEETDTDTGRSVDVDVAVRADDPRAAKARLEALFAADPDFELMTLSEVIEIANPRALSAQAQSILRDAADELRQDLREDIQALRAGASYEDTGAVSQHLPAGFARHYTPNLLAQWAGSVEAVSHKFAAYPDTYLATSAEELAGHALIQLSQELVDERQDNLGDPDGLREKFAEVHDLAFEDHDVLMLFDARLDGIEDDIGGGMLGVANLHPRDWFKPFRSEE